MLIKLDNLLGKVTNWKTVLVLFVISFPIGYYIERPLFYKIGQLDYYYSYTVDNLYSSISNFYSSGLLEKYLTYQQTFQIFFPLITALFFITFIYHTGNGLISKKILLPFAFIIPSATLLIDYLENVGLIVLVRSYIEAPYVSFAPKLRSIAEITSNIAPIKGVLWDMEFLIFFAGVAIYIFKTIRFLLKKTGILEKFKKNLSYSLLISSINKGGYDIDFENNILALAGVIGLIGILALIAIFLRSISPYPVQ